MSSSTLCTKEGKTDTGIYFRQTCTDESAPALALVMGYAGSCRIWPERFISKLGQSYRVITYDNRGTGASVVPEVPTDYSIKAMSDDLHSVLTHLDARDIYLLGYSMGGCIALQYAHDHGNNVRSLFLMCSTAGGAMYAKPDAELSRQLANPDGKTLREIYMSTFKLMYSPEALTAAMPILDEIYEDSKDYATRPIAMQGHSHAFRNFDASGYAAGLKMPTTVLAGTDDRLMPLLNSQNLAKAIPNSRLVLLPGCEHAPHIQEMDLVVDEINNAFR